MRYSSSTYPNRSTGTVANDGGPSGSTDVPMGTDESVRGSSVHDGIGGTPAFGIGESPSLHDEPRGSSCQPLQTTRHGGSGRRSPPPRLGALGRCWGGMSWPKRWHLSLVLRTSSSGRA